MLKKKSSLGRDVTEVLCIIRALTGFYLGHEKQHKILKICPFPMYMKRAEALILNLSPFAPKDREGLKVFHNRPRSLKHGLRNPKYLRDLIILKEVEYNHG